MRYRKITTAANVLKVEKRVQEALANGKPVVALESTIVAHGMPYPQNLELQREVEMILLNKVLLSFFLCWCSTIKNLTLISFARV
jgi:pseudouridine-5'-phosphate glycosidase